MRSLTVTLVNPPHQATPLGDEKEIAPPLGLLKLAASLMHRGHVPRLEDLNLRWHLDPTLRVDFYRRAVGDLVRDLPDIVGFTSMAVDTHVALLLAEAIKAVAPDTIVVLGGPHAGPLADQIRVRWPAVDVVVAGDGTAKLSEIADLAARYPRGPMRLAAVRQLTPFGHQPDEETWDVLGGYSLINWAEYFEATGRRHANVEAGKGCRFRCSFCYSPGHHREWRTRSIDSLLSELAYLEASGVEDVFFVEDNFLNSPAWSADAAGAISAAHPALRWSCYATLPALDSGVLGELAKGGCRAIFSGVDAITPMARRAYHKSFARDVRRVIEVYEAARANEIVPTFAFLVAPPSHSTGMEIDATVAAAATLQALDLDALRVRLNVLAYYPGTAIDTHAVRWAPDRSRVDLLLDVSDEVRDNPLATAAPELFPYHSRYVSGEEWDAFIGRVFVLYTLVDSRPQSLLDLNAGHGWSPTRVASWVLSRLPPLAQILKDLRREAVIEQFDAAFHAAA